MALGALLYYDDLDIFLFPHTMTLYIDIYRTFYICCLKLDVNALKKRNDGVGGPCVVGALVAFSIAAAVFVSFTSATPPQPTTRSPFDQLQPN